MGKLYTPPAGYYDLPFYWCYDASGLTDGQDALNQFIYLQGGYGDFVLRRLVGMSRCLEPYNGLAANTGGRFLIRDRYKNPLQAAPIYAWGAPDLTPREADLGFAPEVFYPETGQISFDLYDILKPDMHPSSAQIAFQGVRRMKGELPRKPGFRAKPKTFEYVDLVTLNGLLGSAPVNLRVKVDDYDFELFQINLVHAIGSVVVFGSESGIATWTRVLPGPPGDVTISMTLGVGPNAPYSFSVVGDTIAIVCATDGTSSPISTLQDVLNSYNASAQAQALAFLAIDLPTALMPTDPAPKLLGPAANYGAIINPFSKMWIYDSNKIQLSNMPMLDVFLDGTPGGIYENGALVTPVYYPKDSQIQIQFFSVIEDASQLGTQIYVHLVGRQWYPC